MFGLFKKNPPPPAQPPSPARTIRDTLFGDALLTDWPPAGASSQNIEPWKSFVEARNAIGEDRRSDAAAAWRRVTEMPRLESRHYAQAWHFLKVLNIAPPAEKVKQLLGIVLEVTVNGGLDLLAVYPERTARYYNYSGNGVIWEHPDASLDPFIDAVLSAGQQVLDAIGPWDKPRPPAPPAGHVRLNVLSPAGLHFGQGTVALMNDPMAKPTFDAGAALMQELIKSSAARR